MQRQVRVYLWTKPVSVSKCIWKRLSPFRFSHCKKHRVSDEGNALKFLNYKRKCRQKRQKPLLNFVLSAILIQPDIVYMAQSDRPPALTVADSNWLAVPQWQFSVRNWASYMEKGLSLVWYDIFIYCNRLSTLGSRDTHIIRWSIKFFIFMKPALLSGNMFRRILPDPRPKNVNPLTFSQVTHVQFCAISLYNINHISIMVYPLQVFLLK
jgi:hypothetical protein